MDQRASIRWLQRVLLVVGLLLIGLWVRSNTEARVLLSAEEKELEAARAASQQPWCPATLERGVFGRIEIPRLGISALIAEGTMPAQLDRTVGHISTTAFPGQPSNCALAGDGTSFLRGLASVRERDVILIDTLQDTYLYEVEWVAVVGPDRVGMLDSTAVPSLTLVTSDRFHSVGSALECLAVRARLVERVPGSTAIRDSRVFEPQDLVAEKLKN